MSVVGYPSHGPAKIIPFPVSPQANPSKRRLISWGRKEKPRVPEKQSRQVQKVYWLGFLLLAAAIGGEVWSSHRKVAPAKASSEQRISAAIAAGPEVALEPR